MADFCEEFREFAPELILDMIPLRESDAVGVMDTFRGIARRVVTVSSQDVYGAYGKFTGTETGPPENFPAGEDSSLRKNLYPYRGMGMGLDDYDKITVERVVMGEPEISGTVLRLPMVYGPGDRQHRLFNFLKPMDDGRPAVLLQEGLHSWRWTRGYVENVSLAVAMAVTEEKAAGQIYNVGEEISLSMEEWVREIGRVAGWKGKILTVPEDLLPENLRMKENTEHHLVTDTTKIRKDLAFFETVSFDEGLKRAIEWERNNSPVKIDPLQFDYDTEDRIIRQLDER